MNQKRVNDRINAWLGWYSIGYVANGDRVVEHFALDQEYETRGVVKKARKIVPFDELTDYCHSILKMFEVLQEAQLLYEMGVSKRTDYWSEECFAIVRGEHGESAKITSNSPSSALAEAFVSYLDKYGDNIKI